MSETETVEQAGDGDASPLAGMDADMAANPQPTFKLLRDEMPVLEPSSTDNTGISSRNSLKVGCGLAAMSGSMDVRGFPPDPASAVSVSLTGLLRTDLQDAVD